MKKLSIIISTFMLLFVLAACNNSQTSSPPSVQESNANSGSENSSSEPVEIDFWYALGGASGELIQTMVEDFNSSQDEVKVNATYQGDYYENHAKVLAAIPANNQPDVTMVEIGSIGAFADAGALADLQSFVDGDNGVDLNDFIPGLMSSSYYNETLYALPLNRSTPLLYINKTMLEENGLDPAGPKNWEELEEFSRQLSIKDERWGFETPIDIWFYEAFVFQNGGNILTEDGQQPVFHEKEAVEPVEFWQSMIEEGIMKMPPGEKYNAWDVAKQDFVNQKVAMILDSTGSLNGILDRAQNFEVGTAFLPAKKDYGVPTGGANIVMLSKSEEKEAAWSFIKWMTDTEQTARMSEGTGYMPARISAAEGDMMNELYKEKPQFEVAINQLEYAKPRPTVPAYKELQEIIMTEIQRAVIDKTVSAQEALNEAAKKAEQLLQ